MLFVHPNWLAQRKVITQANQNTFARGFVIAHQVQFSAQVLLLLVYCLLQLSSSELIDNQYLENIYRDGFPCLQMFLDSSNLGYSDSLLFISKPFLYSTVFTESMNLMSLLPEVASFEEGRHFQLSDAVTSISFL